MLEEVRSQGGNNGGLNKLLSEKSKVEQEFN